jgi:hypothetical protein
MGTTYAIGVEAGVEAHTVRDKSIQMLPLAEPVNKKGQIPKKKTF